MKSIASRWFPERLRIALCPDRVMVARLGLGPRTRVLEKFVINCPAETPGHPWRAPLAALADMLAQRGKIRTLATVIVSNHFVRYALVPWRHNIASDREQLALARHCFRRIHGDAADTWDIRLSDDGFNRNLLASALDREFMPELNQVLSAHKVSVSSIQPYFMTACNRFRRELKSKAGCLAVLESGRATLGAFDASGWQILTTRRLASDAPAALASLLTQELAALDPKQPTWQLSVVAADHPRFAFAFERFPTQVLRLKPQRGFSPFEDAGCAMAMCGTA